MRSFFALVALLSVPACDGFTAVEDTGVRDGPTHEETSSRDGRAIDTPGGGDAYPSGGTGPGPFGALPSGYCCTSPDVCRDRRCVDHNGSSMCMNLCTTDEACLGPVAGFHCNEALGRCEPDVPTATCVPADQFRYGARKLGACCLATHDGWAGIACEGYHCGAFNDGPFICTQVCTKPTDCPGNFMCSSLSAGYAICVPYSYPYTCVD